MYQIGNCFLKNLHSSVPSERVHTRMPPYSMIYIKHRIGIKPPKKMTQTVQSARLYSGQHCGRAQTFALSASSFQHPLYLPSLSSFTHMPFEHLLYHVSTQLWKPTYLRADSMERLRALGSSRSGARSR